MEGQLLSDSLIKRAMIPAMHDSFILILVLTPSFQFNALMVFGKLLNKIARLRNIENL